ncbi:ran-specific GTPase-activating protein isoform X2 [Eurytemora carolleeae]|uniref:ran-specific GTPase-activating protein isoform X2 n=1 Tax=Eurytemora carolleeae TaxID=1294199 RepID=UPI000C7672FE|nr:ran-specific GTPase-activating protein isoform X2 [Eurytemora carolleeae]|eukprot:XP_023334211.1 ran-specific GTPase-activating protein-like isoform X2 [Eurytemora affinis]
MPDSAGVSPSKMDKPAAEDPTVDPEDAKHEEDTSEDKNNDSVCSIDPYYPPIIYLPEIVVNSGEDEEEEMIKIRAKLYRYAHECDPPEWKERGTGDIRILKHIEKNTCRIVMRREKTLKLCANHFIVPWMELKPNSGSDKAWVWKTQADCADEESKPETLAARFSNPEKAKLWEKAFEKARKYVLESEAAEILKQEGRGILGGVAESSQADGRGILGGGAESSQDTSQKEEDKENDEPANVDAKPVVDDAKPEVVEKLNEESGTNDALTEKLNDLAV